MYTVDVGLGRDLKREYGVQQDIWLESDHNLQAWEDGSISASERRILITSWLGQAWENLQNKPGFSARVRRYFEKTGCLITVDGSFDGNIKPQGTVNYSFAVSDSSSSSSSSSVSQIEMESKYDDGDVPLSTDKSSEPEDCDSSDDSDVVHHSGKDEPDSEEELLQTLDECIPDGWEWMPKPNDFNFLTSIGERVVFFWIFCACATLF